MRISKVQRALLEHIWLNTTKIPIQLVADVLGINKRLHPKKVQPTANGTHAPELRKMLPVKLLDHLLKIRVQSQIKPEKME